MHNELLDYFGMIILEFASLHSLALQIEDSHSESETEGKVFPDGDKTTFRLLCMALTPEFLILGSEVSE